MVLPLFVGFPSLFVAPSGEQLALPMCWRETSLPTISCVFVPIFFSVQSVTVDVERMGFRSRGLSILKWTLRRFSVILEAKTPD